MSLWTSDPQTGKTMHVFGIDCMGFHYAWVNPFWLQTPISARHILR